MSFTTDLEAGPQYRDHPEFERLTHQIDTTLYAVNHKHLVLLRNLLLQYEQALQSPDPGRLAGAAALSHKLAQLTAACAAQFESLGSLQMQLAQTVALYGDEDADTVLYLRQKETVCGSLVRNALVQFQSLQQRYNGLQQHVPESAPEEPELVLSQVQIAYEPVNAEELEQQTLRVQEREREIARISRDTEEINAIFSNLQDVIHEQQFQVNAIEDNIMSYSADVRAGEHELRRAERRQRRLGGRMFCCLLILLGVVGSIVLVGVVF